MIVTNLEKMNRCIICNKCYARVSAVEIYAFFNNLDDKYTDFNTLPVIVKYMLMVCHTDFNNLIVTTVYKIYKLR